jgi:beta-phosphoglucomutase-like phosphatase (HAD superfamily)
VDVILLDYNGVVVDDEAIHFAALRDLLAVERMALDEAGYRAHFLGLDDRTCIREAFRRAGRPLDPDAVGLLAARKAAWYAESVRGGIPLVAGVGRFVRAAAATARLAIVSGALRAEVAAGLALAGLTDLVPVVVSAEDVAAGKPDPEGYRLALQRLTDGAAVRAVVLEDSRPGLAAARALGAGCVAFTTTHPAGELGGADLVWRSFEGHAPAELAPLFRSVAVRARD